MCVLYGKKGKPFFSLNFEFNIISTVAKSVQTLYATYFDHFTDIFAVHFQWIEHRILQIFVRWYRYIFIWLKDPVLNFTRNIHALSRSFARTRANIDFVAAWAHLFEKWNHIKHPPKCLRKSQSEKLSRSKNPIWFLCVWMRCGAVCDACVERKDKKKEKKTSATICSQYPDRQ